MEWFFTFLFGMIGGIALEVIRVYKILQQDKEFTYPRILLVLSLCMAILGGVLAVALEANTPFIAIWIGVSTPAIISSLGKNPIRVK